MDWLVSRNPSNGYRRNGRVPCASPRSIAAAAARARAAAPGWDERGVEERVRLLRPLRAKLAREREALARTITVEMGKPIRESRDEVGTTIEELDYFLECGAAVLRDVVYAEDEVRRDILRREPWGVAAVISPWNYPLEIALWGIVPNLLCGNTVLFKPSEIVPLTARRLADLFDELDLEPGVFQPVFGRRAESRRLVACEEVDLVWFTGSSRVGEQVHAMAGRRFVKSVMELGGSSPALVFDDVDVSDQLVRRLVNGRFTNCGQTCSATKRLFVHRVIYERVLSALVERVCALRIGDPLDESTEISSLASRRQLETVLDQLGDARRRRARVECGGSTWDGRPGAYLSPTVLTRVMPGMKVLKEEVFGPVLPVVPFGTDEDAVRLANETPYGLSAEVYTEDRERAARVAGRIKAGRITINSPRLPGISCPFGGYKKSGMGREHGPWGFFELSQLKHVMVKK